MASSTKLLISYTIFSTRRSTLVRPNGKILKRNIRFTFVIFEKIKLLMMVRKQRKRKAVDKSVER